MVIYLDVLILVNLAMDYLILLTVARLAGIFTTRLHLLGGATIGAGYAALALFIPALAQPLGMATAGFCMVMVSFWQFRPQWIRLSFLFLLVSGAFAGITMIFAQMGGALQHIGSGYYVNIPIRILFPAACLCYLASGVLFQGQGAAQAQVEVKITLDGKTQTYLLLCDTGNQLCDPISNRPALLLNRTAVARLFPAVLTGTLLQLQNQSASQVYADLPELWRSRFVLLPYRTASDAGMLLAFRPDGLMQANKPLPHLVAISPHVIQGRYDGLVGVS